MLREGMAGWPLPTQGCLTGSGHHRLLPEEKEPIPVGRALEGEAVYSVSLSEVWGGLDSATDHRGPYSCDGLAPCSASVKWESLG